MSRPASAEYEPLVDEAEEAADRRFSIQSFDDFIQKEPVHGVPVGDSVADVTRVLNIPDLPSASAKWRSPEVRRVFVAMLMVSICLLMVSLPLTILLIGLPGFVASVMGIVLSSMYLCESCQSDMIQSDVNAVSILSTICIALDSIASVFFFVLFWDSVWSGSAWDVMLLWLILFVLLPVAHLVLAAYARKAALELKAIMRPVRSGMMVLA